MLHTETPYPIEQAVCNSGSPLDRAIRDINKLIEEASFISRKHITLSTHNFVNIIQDGGSGRLQWDITPLGERIMGIYEKAGYRTYLEFPTIVISWNTNY